MAGSAFRIDGPQDVLQLASHTSAYPLTVLFWAYISVSRTDYSPIVAFEAGSSFIDLAVSASSTALLVRNNVNLWDSIGTMGVGTWRKVAMVVTSGHVDCYFGTEGTPGVALTFGYNTTNLTGVPDYQGVGSASSANTNWFNGRVSGLRIWSAALTEAEIEEEFKYSTPQRTLNLFGAWFPPTVTAGTVLTAIAGADLVDGYGRGTPDYTVEDGPTLDAASADVIAARSVQLAGAAGLLPRSSAVTTRTASMSGTAALSPSPGGIAARTYALAGSATLSPSPASVAPSPASFAGGGTLTCSLGRVVSVAAACSGTASLSASPAATCSTSAQLSGTGSVSATAAAIASTPTALQGSATLTAVGAAVASRSCSAASTATLSAAASSIASASAPVSGAASFSATSSAIASHGAGFGASAAVSWSTAATVAVAATLSGVADFAPSSPSEDGSVTRSAEFSGAGAFEPSATTVAVSCVALLSSSSFSPGSASVVAVSSDCSGDASLVAGAACLRVASASFAGSARLRPATATESVSPVIIAWIDATLRDPSAELALLSPATFDVALLDPSVTLDLRPAAAVA